MQLLFMHRSVLHDSPLPEDGEQLHCGVSCTFRSRLQPSCHRLLRMRR